MSLLNSNSLGELGRSRLTVDRPLPDLGTSTRCSRCDRGHSRRWLALCIALLTIAAVQVRVAQASFISAHPHAAGDNPMSVAVGDFNGDGIPDLAVANYLPNGTVTILLGKGSGTFQAPQSYAVGYQPNFVVIGDFDGDGHLDLAVANFGTGGSQLTAGFVSVLLGNGDGTFKAAKSYAVGVDPYSVAIGDFNGDGHPDLAVTNYTSYTVSVLLGNGDGTFQLAQTYTVGSAPTLTSVAVGDFNGDGHQDLAVANLVSGTVSILLGNGDGTFRAGATFAAGTSYSPGSLAVGDFNGDGIPDLAVAGAGVGILLGNGDGTFQAAQSYAAFYAPFVVVGDLNGDGNLDLAVALDSGVIVLQGNGDGTFLVPPVSFAVESAPRSLAIGDLDGDGHADLAVADDQAGVTILLGKGDGTFPTAPRSYRAGSGSLCVAAADFNGDGIPDLALANVVDSSVSILLGRGDGTFQPAQSYDAGSASWSVAAGDFNGDGIPDLVVGNNYGDSVSVLLGNGDGSFQTARNFPAGSTPLSVAVGDFDGDGHLDLAVANYGEPNGNIPGTVSVLLGNGDGSFKAAQNYVAGLGAIFVAVGDFNGDGISDLAVANEVPESKGTVSILLGNGDGTFRAGATFAAGTSPICLAVADFNGDGKTDIVTTNFAFTATARPGTQVIIESDIRVFLGNGDGTFQAAQVYTVSSNSWSVGPRSVAIGDFNKDGIPDLAVATGGASGFFLGTTVNVLLGNGDGTFQVGQGYAAGGYASFVVAADLNDDGYPDLAVADNLKQGSVTVLLNAADWGR